MSQKAVFMRAQSCTAGRGHVADVNGWVCVQEYDKAFHGGVCARQTSFSISPDAMQDGVLYGS